MHSNSEIQAFFILQAHTHRMKGIKNLALVKLIRIPLCWMCALHIVPCTVHEHANPMVTIV